MSHLFHHETPEQKAARFDAKALQWEQKGNATKAAKNKQKALKYRQRAPKPAGAVRPAIVPGSAVKTDKAARYEAKALEYERKGNAVKAQKNRERAWNLRDKHSIVHPVGAQRPITLGQQTQVHGQVPLQTSHVTPSTNIVQAHSHGQLPAQAQTQAHGQVHAHGHGQVLHPQGQYQRETPQQKAARFEAKALQWEQKGNAAKATKNREKALRYRHKTPRPAGTVLTGQALQFKTDRAARNEAKALEYERRGNAVKAQRCREKAWRMRERHSIAHPAGLRAPSTHIQTQGQTPFPTGQLPSGNVGFGQYPHETAQQKAARYEAKALAWEQKGNAAKATKNKQKALRYRQKTPRAAGVLGARGLTGPALQFKTDKAARYEAKALEYERRGNAAKAQRCRERAWHTRERHSIAHPTGIRHPSTYIVVGQQSQTYGQVPFQTGQLPSGFGQTGQYQYQYQRETAQQKAARFEAKALQWEQKGNAAKAAKNREKALRYRQKTPRPAGTALTAAALQFKTQRAAHYEIKAVEYERRGNTAKALRCREKAWRLRETHSIAHPAGCRHPSTYIIVGQQSSITIQNPIVHPTEIVNTAIIQESVRTDKIVEIQPVVHREVDRKVVHHIEKHIQEPAAPNLGGIIERPALVQQTQHTNVITEIQPIIHREVAVPVKELVEQHYTERIVEPTIHTHEVIYERAAYATGQQTRIATQVFTQEIILFKTQRASRYEIKAVEYDRRGNTAKALRCREKAWRLREKYSIAHPAGCRHPSTYIVVTQGQQVPLQGGQYQYQYQRETPLQKAVRFEAKALAWEQKGNAVKATKNRQKAVTYRQKLDKIPLGPQMPFSAQQQQPLPQQQQQQQQHVGLLHKLIP